MWDRLLSSMLAGALLAFGTTTGPSVAAAATDWGKAVVDSTMRRFPDPRDLPWRYPRALFLHGQYQVYLRTGQTAYLDYIRSWADAHVDEAGTMYFDAAHRDPVDLSDGLEHLLPGRLMIIMHQLTGRQKYRLAADKLRQRFDVWPRTSDGGFWHRWPLTNQLWADGTYAALPFLIEYGRAYGDAAYAEDEAARQLLVYGEHLQDAATGLLVHAYDEDGSASWADPATKRSPEFWCRGMAWYGVALVEVLELLPSGHAERDALLDRLNRFAAGIVRFQDRASGRWFQVVDKASLSRNWLETSCSAMFGYVLGRGIEQGLLAPSYHDAAARAYQGVLQTISIGSDGLTNLVETVFSTGVGDLDYYLARPRVINDWHGLGTFLFMYEQFNKQPADAVLIWREAESGGPTTPLIVRSDAKASRRKAVRVRDGANSLGSVPSRGRLRLSFTLPRAGSYRIWGRVIAPTSRDDSFWLRVDGGAWRVWDGIELGRAWHWTDVHTTAGSGETLSFNLTAGPHTLDIAHREDGIRLDRLLITNVPTFVPGVTGG